LLESPSRNELKNFSVSTTVQEVQPSFCANNKINTYIQERGQNKGKCDRNNKKKKGLLQTPC